MPEIGSYEAKTHLPKLLELVQQGQRFVITKHGRPVAELVPVTRRNSVTIRDAIGAIRAGRKALAARGIRLANILDPDETLRDLTRSGHRY